MFSLLRLIWSLITISTCSVKDGHWSCTEFCLIEVTEGCDSHFTDLSKSSISTLIKYQSNFIDFANGYYRNYFNPVQKQLLTTQFLELIHRLTNDLSSRPEVPDSDTRWIRSRLLISYIKFKTLAKEETSFDLIPEFRGVRETLQWSLKDLDLNATKVQGSKDLADVVDWGTA